MKKFEFQLIGLVVAFIAFVTHQTYTLADEYADDSEDFFAVAPHAQMKALTPEEEALANEARAYIAKTIENNLVRLLAIVAARGDRQGRQEEETETEGEDAAVTPNPNVLPQVAQILGAIFSGSLNITRVVDQTFGLVPNLVRNQVGGLVKLLTGESMEEATSTAAPQAATTPPTPAGSVAINAPQDAIVVTVPAPVVYETTVVVPTSAPDPEELKATTETTTPFVETETKKQFVVIEDEEFEEIVKVTQASSKPQSTTTEKGRYKLRNRTKPSTTPRSSIFEDDEIEKLEADLRRAARAYEPYVRNKQPRFFTTAFRNIFSRVDFNMTEIARAVPTIFKGARQAFIVLENLGVLDVNEVLDELGVPAAGGEEEE